MHWISLVVPEPNVVRHHNPASEASCIAQGVLKGYDQATNLILDECHERVYSTKVCKGITLSRQQAYWGTI